MIPELLLLIPSLVVLTALEASPTFPTKLSNPEVALFDPVFNPDVKLLAASVAELVKLFVNPVPKFSTPEVKLFAAVSIV